MCYGDYGVFFGGGLILLFYVPPPMFVFPMVLIICIPAFFVFSFILYSVFLFSWCTLPLVFLFPSCVHF